jgi:hypothetical protein
MLKSLAVAVEEIEDGLSETAWNDWTPRESRILARSVNVKTSSGYVTLTEADKSDPTRIRMYLTVKGEDSGNYPGATEIDADLTAKELDEIVQALTLARDAAVSEWMLEPVVT